MFIYLSQFTYNLMMVAPMKKIAQITALALCVGLYGCSDNQKENAQEAQRHQASAKVYQDQGQLRAAMLEAKNAIQLEPSSPEGYKALAKIYNQIGAYTATQTLLEKLVEKLPGVSTELAYAYLSSKKFTTALNTINNYPAASDNVADVQRQASIQAMAYMALGDQDSYTKALANFDSLGGNAVEKKYIEANYALSQGKTEDALTLLEAAAQAEPENIKVLSLLGNVHLYMQQLSKAEDYLTKALGLLPKTDILTIDRTQVLTQLTEALIQQGRTSEAYTYQKILAEANPESNAAQQRFNEALEYFQQGKLAEAEKILTELREQFPQDKKTATLLGMVEYQKGSDQKASELFDEFIDPETATPTLIQTAALVKYRSNKMDEAVELLKKATESQPNNAAILATYGLAVLDRDEKSSEGAKALEKSLALNPKQQRVRIALAKRYMALNQPEQAIGQLQKAYQEQPLDVIIQQTYLKALFNNDQAEKVKEEVEQFKKQFPDNSRGPFIEGWYELEQKNYAAAEKAFETSISMKSSTEKHLAYSGLAQIYELQNQPQKAVTSWQLALEAEPGLTAAYGRWLGHMRQLNRQQQAVTFLKGLESKATAWEPSVVLAQLMVAEKNMPAAIEHIKKALELSNNAGNVKQIAASLYQATGIEHSAKGDLNEARSNFLEAVKLYPENADFLANLIQTEITAQNIPEAQKLLDQFTKTDENEGARLFLQGVIRFAEKNQEEGIKLFRMSWGLIQTDGVADAIFSHYQRNNQPELAQKFADEWAEKLPNSYRAALIKAMNAQSKNDADEALKWYEKTIELAPNMPAALNNLAWMYYERKDERALELAKRAYQYAPKSAAILDTYGWILVEKGQVQEGIAILEKAVALEPGAKEIQEHLTAAKARLK